jgi:hypothetical protein
MIKEADIDGDGEINYTVAYLLGELKANGQEFVNMILSK